MRVALLLVAIGLASAFGPRARAADESALSAPASPPRRFSFELELTAEPMARLTGLFDFARLQDSLVPRDESGERSAATSIERLTGADNGFRQRYRRGIADDYLRDDPTALDRLPSALRDELTRGLDLGPRVLQERKPILAADGSALADRPALILPGNGTEQRQGGIILPGQSRPAGVGVGVGSVGGTLNPMAAPPPAAPPPSASGLLDDGILRETESGIRVTRRGDWDELERRWRALPPAQRFAVVDWSRLGPLQKALLAYTYLPSLVAREDLPPRDRELLAKLLWTRDGEAVEFNYRDDVIVRDKDELRRDLVDLARRAGVEREVTDPEAARMLRTARKDPRRWGSLHLHASAEGRPLRPLVRLLNVQLALRRLQLGIMSDWLGGDVPYRFQPSLISHGLVRIERSGDHFETRAHHAPLRDELDRLDRLLAYPSLDTAIAEVQKEIGDSLTPEVISGLARFGDRPDARETLIEQLVEARPGHIEHLVEEAGAFLTTPGGDPAERAARLEVLHAFDPTSAKLRDHVFQTVRDPSSFREIARRVPATFAYGLDLGSNRKADLADARRHIEAYLAETQAPELRAAAARVLLEQGAFAGPGEIEIRRGVRSLIDMNPWPLDDARMFALAERFGLLGEGPEALEVGIAMLRRTRAPDTLAGLLGKFRTVRTPAEWRAPPDVVEKVARIGAGASRDPDLRTAAHDVLYRFAPERTDLQRRFASWFVAALDDIEGSADPYFEKVSGAQVETELVALVDKYHPRAADLLARIGPVSPATRAEVARIAARRPSSLDLSKLLYRISPTGSPERKAAVDAIARGIRGYTQIKRPSGSAVTRGWDRDDFRFAWDHALKSVDLADELRATETPIVRELVRFRHLSGMAAASDEGRATDAALSHVPAMRARQASGAAPACGVRFRELLKRIKDERRNR